MRFFQRKSLQNLTSLENLDKLLTVVGLKGWVILLFFVLVFASFLFWAFFGKVPITTSGKAIFMDPTHSYVIRAKASGTVQTILKMGGESVQKGEPIVILENSSLSSKIVDRKQRILLLQKEIGEGGQNESAMQTRLNELFLLSENLTSLEKEKRELIVRAPHHGRLIWVDLNEGENVSIGDSLLTMRAPTDVHSLKVFAFIPLKSAEQIRAGMKAHITLNRFNPEKYGMVIGSVEGVLPYPISPTEYYMQKIPSEPLKKYLAGDTLAVVLVVIQPSLNPNTYSGLSWTSGSGPEEHVESSFLGTAIITLQEIKPIEYVLPLLEKPKI